MASVPIDEDDFFMGENRWGDRGLEPDFGHLPAHYARDDQSRSGRHARWIGPFFGDHLRPPVPRHPRGVAPRGYRHGDERLYEDVCFALGQSTQLDPSDVEVRVQDGEVTLSGTVADRREKKIAEFLALGVDDVVDVHNRLRIRSLSG